MLFELLPHNRPHLSTIILSPLTLITTFFDVDVTIILFFR